MHTKPKAAYRSRFTTYGGQREEFTVQPVLTFRLSEEAQAKLVALAHIRGCSKAALLEHVLQELELEMVLPADPDEEEQLQPHGFSAPVVRPTRFVELDEDALPKETPARHGGFKIEKRR